MHTPDLLRLPRVLVVDDDDFMRDILRCVLVGAGIAVETFASAAELLALADLEQPALLLLDLKMPGMSGAELQALLQARGVTLPVMFLSGACDVAIAVAAMQNGAVDLMEKPFDSAALIGRLHLAWSRAVHAATVVPRTSDFEAAEGPREPDHRHAARMSALTPRERVVCDLMVTGMSSKTMARQLGGSFRTIDIHRSRVMAKLAVANLAELVRLSLGVEIRG